MYCCIRNYLITNCYIFNCWKRKCWIINFRMRFSRTIFNCLFIFNCRIRNYQIIWKCWIINCWCTEETYSNVSGGCIVSSGCVAWDGKTIFCQSIACISIWVYDYYSTVRISSITQGKKSDCVVTIIRRGCPWWAGTYIGDSSCFGWWKSVIWCRVCGWSCYYCDFCNNWCFLLVFLFGTGDDSERLKRDMIIMYKTLFIFFLHH